MSKRHSIDTIVRSPEELMAAGASFVTSLTPPAIICLHGDLGAGKTTFAKGAISTLTNVDVREITSPTFQYMHLYSKDPNTIVHFDLWRLKSLDEFLALGLEEFLHQGIVLIEWPDRIESILPPEAHHITLSVVDGGRQLSLRTQCPN